MAETIPLLSLPGFEAGPEPAGDWFATIEDMEAFLQITITGDAEKEAAANRALGEATTAIRNYCRQWLSLVDEEEVTLDAPRGKRLLLPELPVVAISEVVEEGETLTVNEDYRLGSGGMVYRLKGNVWNWWGESEGLQNIVVTYSHGYTVIPDDIVQVCTRAASRAYQAGLKAEENAGVGGVVSKSLGDFSVGYAAEASTMEGTMGVSGARLLLMSEKDLLNKFRI